VAVEWVRLELDLHAFDGAPYQQYLQRCRSAGIEFTTMGQLGDTVEQRRALFELNKLCSADIPERGTFSTWEVYEAERLNVAGYDPQGVMLALDQGRWAGMSATSLRRDKGIGTQAAGCRLRAGPRPALAAHAAPSGQLRRHRPEPPPGLYRQHGLRGYSPSSSKSSELSAPVVRRSQSANLRPMSCTLSPVRSKNVMKRWR